MQRVYAGCFQRSDGGTNEFRTPRELEQEMYCTGSVRRQTAAIASALGVRYWCFSSRRHAESSISRWIGVRIRPLVLEAGLERNVSTVLNWCLQTLPVVGSPDCADLSLPITGILGVGAFSVGWRNDTSRLRVYLSWTALGIRQDAKFERH